MRQIALDTETTGLEVSQGHRIIEIGAVEIQDRQITGRQFHYYLQPDREIDPAATAVHGIRLEDLADKPRFAEITDAFLAFITGAELLIHNAAFDTGFLNSELCQLTPPRGLITDYSTITDTLALAKSQHPGQKNNLDALCKRYGVDNSKREAHGALLDAQLLAEVYLAMTGGQVSLLLETQAPILAHSPHTPATHLLSQRADLPIITADTEEQAAHERYLQFLQKSSGGQCVWLKLNALN